MRTIAIWIAVVAVLIVPVLAASFSPLLAWRNPIYILAGFSGIFAMSVMLIQPLLAARVLPGLDIRLSKRLHRALGLTLIFAVAVHVLALWITSPPDVIDALLFVSPTPFSVWGVAAMWAVFAAGMLVLLRRRLHLRWATWRMVHIALVSIAVAGTVVHALLIEGTMELVSKIALSVLVVVALGFALLKLRR